MGQFSMKLTALKGSVLGANQQAHALAGDRERCIAAGMDDYIPKPFNPGQLEAVLRRALKPRS